MNFIPNVNEVINNTVEIEKTVEVNVLESRVKEAQEAAHASTTAKAQAAYDEVYATQMKAIEDEVKAEYITEIKGTMSPE